MKIFHLQSGLFGEKQAFAEPTARTSMRDRGSQSGRETESNGCSPSGTTSSWREQVFHPAQGIDQYFRNFKLSLFCFISRN